MRRLPFWIALVGWCSTAIPVPAVVPDEVASVIAGRLSDWLEFYRDLHAHPELSLGEERTAARLAGALRAAGCEVTERVGGFGVVGVVRNGPGPTVLLRADMDALPIPEETGLAYASTVRGTDARGRPFGVMHACGHDIHTAGLAAVAEILVRLRSRWSGTLVFVGQPAEEVFQGARAMLEAGLYKRFPRPDHALAVHVTPSAAGTFFVASGPILAAADAVDILVQGIGGHGSSPHNGKDPIVLAAQLVLALQALASREVAATDAAVVTVGTIHGGTRRNVIPDEVRLELTLRTLTPDVRNHLRRRIPEIAAGLGQAYGLPETLRPVVSFRSEESVATTVNDPGLSSRVRAAATRWLGEAALIPFAQAPGPGMGAEDFSAFGATTERVPTCMIMVGATNAETLADARRQGLRVPGLHSSRFAPDASPTLATVVRVLTAAVVALAPPEAVR